MSRYVTLQVEGDDGFPVTDSYPDADRDEVAGCVNEEYPEVVPVMVPDVVTVTAVTTHRDGTTTTETYEKTLGEVADPSGATVETGVMLSRIADPGGHLCVYAGAKLLRQYEAGEWRSCSEEPPSWLTEGVR